MQDYACRIYMFHELQQLSSNGCTICQASLGVDKWYLTSSEADYAVMNGMPNGNVSGNSSRYRD